MKRLKMLKFNRKKASKAMNNGLHQFPEVDLTNRIYHRDDGPSNLTSLNSRIERA